MSARRDEDGVVLLLILVLIVVTISTVYAMAKTTTLEIMGTRYRSDRVRADLLARSGRVLALQSLEDDLSLGDAVTQTTESTHDAWALLGQQPIEVAGGGVLRVMITDIGAKLNLNALVNAEGEVYGESKEFLKAALRRITDTTPRLLEEGPLTDEKVDDLADGILDWLDRNDATRLGTPEEEYYLGIKKAESGPIDRPAFSLDELAAVPGMNALLLEAMKSYFTTHPMFPAEGSGGINFNTAPAHVLALLYHGAGLEYELTNERNILEILRVRKEGRVFCDDTSDERCISAAEALGVISEGEVYFPPIQNRGHVFSIEIEATVREARSCVSSIVDREADAISQTLYYRLGC